MRIAGITAMGHPGLGDFELDFRDASGKAPRVLVLAGENGCGKSSVLDLIYAALAPTNIMARTKDELGHYFLYCEVDKAHSDRVTRPSASQDEMPVDKMWRNFDGFIIEAGSPEVFETVGYHAFNRYWVTGAERRSQTGFQTTESALNTNFACFYCEADLSSNVPDIDAFTGSGEFGSTDIDRGTLTARIRSSATLSKDIAQLLVDLQAADNADSRKWLRLNPTGRQPEESLDPRVRRFSDAFAKMITHKRYIGYETIGGKLVPQFQQGDIITSLSRLSTGEKQIIFRGAFLLREASNLPGAVVLIDEPELGLHPAWQAQILSYYDEIVGHNDSREGQLIVATHSPFVVHGSPTAKHVILRRDQHTKHVRTDEFPSYPGVTVGDTAIAAFDLGNFISAVSAKSAAIVVEGPTDKSIFETAWSKLNPKRTIPFAILPAGGALPLMKLLRDSTGKGGSLIEALAAVGTHKVIGVWDFDHAGIPQWNGTIKEKEAEASDCDLQRGVWRKRRGEGVWAALLTVPTFRAGDATLDADMLSQSRLTTELLFPDLYVEPLLSRISMLGVNGGGFLKANDSQKQHVAKAAVNFPPEAFAGFTPLFDLFARLLA